MSTRFDDATFLKNDDLICPKDRVETVGNRDDGTPLHQAAGRFFEKGFGFGVQAGGGLVEDKNRGVFQKGAGERESLCLSPAETRTAFADDRFILFWQCFDELMQMRRLGCGNHFLVCSLWLAETNICGNRVMEEIRLLRDPGD